MAGRTPKGTRYGGRATGTPNRRTVESIERASQEIGEIKRAGQRRATEVLNDFMQSVGGMAAMYQQRIVGAKEKANAKDVEMFKWSVEMTEKFARALAPFQSPTFKAIAVTVNPGDKPMAAIADDGKTIDDPAALMRVYQQTMRQIT